jgi:glycosyltransferase involved in cell wall biosynthesis
MTEQKVAACIITGDNWDEEEVKKLLRSLEPHVHGIFVNYNGKKRKLSWQNWTTLPITVKKFKWEDNFSLARNQSFSLVPKDKFDWFFWIDSDDILVADENSLQEMFDSLDEYTEGIFVRYAYAVEPNTDIVVVEQWRERFLSTSQEWKWEFPIHEVCRSNQGIQFAKRDHCYIRHQRTSGEDRGARERNRKIIAKSMAENPNEPRFQFYFAGETLAEADSTPDGPEKLELIEAALLAYKKYREMQNDLSDDVYLATARMAELNRMKSDHAAALEADLECIAIYPDWPDGYVGAAKSCMELRDWRRMKSFADMATKCNKPQTSASIEPMLAGFTPLFLRAMANEELGDIDQALVDYKEAQKLWEPPSGDLQKKIDFLENFEENNLTEKNKELRKKLRGTKADKSICFFTQPIPDTWHPETLKVNGAGGAETCIMKLAPMFHADGWRVVVFGTPGHHRGVYEGVEYWNSEEFLPSEKFRVFVSSRSYFPFEANINSDVSFLWMHDVNIGPQNRDYLIRPDAVLGLTNWHKNHLKKLYNLPENKMRVVPNGIDLGRFPVEKFNNESKQRLIYSSSPDRGLDTMLSLWPMIKGRYPEIELHVYYGWEIIDRIIEISKSRGVNAIHLSEFKNRCIQQVNLLGGEDGGIFLHGRVNQDFLAEEMMNSLIWSFPTNFMETFCITAIEMQAAGVVPVTSDLAALSENIHPDYYKITGWPNNASYQRDWLQLLAHSIENKEYREKVRPRAREFAEQFTWDKSYTAWNDLINSFV